MQERQETAVEVRFLDVRAGSRAREPVDGDGGPVPWRCAGGSVRGSPAGGLLDRRGGRGKLASELIFFKVIS